MLSKAPRRSFLSKVPSLLMSINLKQSCTSGSGPRRILLLRLHSVPCPSCLCLLLLDVNVIVLCTPLLGLQVLGTGGLGGDSILNLSVGHCVWRYWGFSGSQQYMCCSAKL